MVLLACFEHNLRYMFVLCSRPNQSGQPDSKSLDRMALNNQGRLLAVVAVSPRSHLVLRGHHWRKHRMCVGFLMERRGSHFADRKTAQDIVDSRRDVSFVQWRDLRRHKLIPNPASLIYKDVEQGLSESDRDVYFHLERVQ